MTLRRRFSAYWARYVAPTRIEHDPGFREVLTRATRRGLRVAGAFGLAAFLAFSITALAVQVLEGERIMSAALQIGVILTDRLQVLAVSVVFFAVARFHPSLRFGRLLIAAYVLAAGLIFLLADLEQAQFVLTAAWLALLLMFATGTVPFQPWQTGAIGLVFTAMLGVAVWFDPDVPVLESGGIMRIVFLLLATFICTAMTTAIYAGRQEQYRSAQRLARLRDRLRVRGFELEARRNDLETQRGELEASLDRLSRAQTQLVQSEKMASLGQLTAGVAHELKNPLNFVNNFSGLSVELLDELRDELTEAGDRPAREAVAESADLIADLRANAEKIREHGQRADGIIRSMLSHSRATPGPRRKAPFNQLLDEYVGLAYHGMRAEHQGANVTIERRYDPGLGEVEMVPEEMSRVFLNLLDNAFAAVRQRAETAGPDYEPTVVVETRADGSDAILRVSDNGTGIPAEVRERVFEPFFTTKPTGEGTGLGLSMTYDIVVNGHGGAVAMETEEGEGTTFTVCLPVSPPPAPPVAGLPAEPPADAQGGG